MTDFFECMAQYLLQNDNLKETVNERIYPHILPQQPVLPSIVYTPITARYDNALQKHTGFVRQIVQFSIHHTSFGKARKVGRILKAVLQDFKGNMNGLNIQATHLINDLSSAGNTMTNYKIEEYVNILEFEFNYNE